MKLNLSLLTGLIVFSMSPALASSICPAPNGGNSGGEGVNPTYITNTVISGGVVQNNTGCNVLITFGPLGAVSTTFPNAAISYDAGDDDNLIGILNNSGSTLTSITLTSATSDIFGFDGDGICGTTSGGQTTTSPGYTFVGGGNPCTHSTDPSGYGGPFTLALAGINDFTGTVTFGNGGILNGGTSWFSLEGPVDENIQAMPTTPEPATVIIFGTGLGGIYLLRRRRRLN